MQRQILIGLVLTLIIVIFIPAYWATESGRHEAARERQRAEAVERGGRLYISNCASCHGFQGEGKIGPALRGSQLDENALERAIASGRPGTAMSAWSEENDGLLKSHQIEDLVTFIKNWDSDLLEELVAEETTKPTPTSTPTPNPAVTLTSTPTPNPTPDLVAEGGQLFSDMGCIGCHSINSQGGKVGPSMVGLFGSEEDLTTGGTVTVDYEYLDESIEDPGAKVVKGYPEVMMPKSSLNHEQIDAIIKFIESLAE